MGGRSKYDYGGKTPHHDDYGSIGTSTKRWHQGWFVNLRGTNAYYTSTMTDDETLTDPENFIYTCFLDPNGATRHFDPSGTFTAGFILLIKNIGTNYSIIFDSTASKQMIRPGKLGMFIYDGTTWR